MSVLSRGSSDSRYPMSFSDAVAALFRPKPKRRVNAAALNRAVGVFEPRQNDTVSDILSSGTERPRTSTSAMAER